MNRPKYKQAELLARRWPYRHLVHMHLVDVCKSASSGGFYLVRLSQSSIALTAVIPFLSEISSAVHLVACPCSAARLRWRRR
jgi:hypothetical protein